MRTRAGRVGGGGRGGEEEEEGLFKAGRRGFIDNRQVTHVRDSGSGITGGGAWYAALWAHAG